MKSIGSNQYKLITGIVIQMDRKVTLIYSFSSCTTHKTYLPENKYWNIVKSHDGNKVMPMDCCSDGDSPNMDIEGKSSDLYRGGFQEFFEYINDFVYISEASINELITTAKNEDIYFMMFSFVDDLKCGTVMITIRVKNEPWRKIKVVIELSNINCSLKTRRFKLYYEQHTLRPLNYLDKLTYG